MLCLHSGLAGSLLAHTGQSEQMFAIHFLGHFPRRPTSLPPNSVSLSLSLGTEQGWWKEPIMKIVIPAFSVPIILSSYESSE